MREKIEFTTLAERPNCAPVIAVYGPEMAGKTRLGATMPARPEMNEEIGVIALDPKCKRTLAPNVAALGKRVITPKEDLVRLGDPIVLTSESVDASIVRYRKHIDRVKQAVFQLLERKTVTSLLIDNGSILWQDMLFAHFGRTQKIMPRDRGQPNSEMAELLGTLMASGKHVLITLRQREVWRNDKPVPGKYTWEGFSGMGYAASAILQLKVDENARSGDMDAKYSLYVRRCQDNQQLEDDSTPLLTGDSITYASVLAAIYPDYEAMEEWC